MKKLVLILTAFILAIVLGLNAGAGPSALQTSVIPADAAWVLHVDVEKYVASRMFKVFSDKEGAPGMHRKAGHFFAKLRMDPLKDLKGITIFGQGKDDEEAVVVISGNFDKTHLLGLLKTDSDHKEAAYGKYTIYNWDGDSFGVFATDNLVLISEREENVKSALDVLDGKKANISSSPLIAWINKESPDALVTAVATSISGLAGERAKPVILSKMRTAAFSLTEKGEALNLKLDIAAESAQVAKDIEQAIRGLIAMANLQLADTATAAILPQDVNINLDGEKVRISVDYPLAKLLDMLKKHGAFPHISLGDLNPLSYF